MFGIYQHGSATRLGRTISVGQRHGYAGLHRLHQNNRHKRRKPGGDTSGNRSINDMVFEPGNSDEDARLGSSATVTAETAASTDRPTRWPPFRTFAQAFDHIGYLARTGQFAINKVSSTVTVFAGTGEGTSGSGMLRRSAIGGATWRWSYDLVGHARRDRVVLRPVLVRHRPGHGSRKRQRGLPGRGSQQRLQPASSPSPPMAAPPFNRIDTGLHADNHAINVAPSDADIGLHGQRPGHLEVHRRGRQLDEPQRHALRAPPSSRASPSSPRTDGS